MGLVSLFFGQQPSRGGGDRPLARLGPAPGVITSCPTTIRRLWHSTSN